MTKDQARIMGKLSHKKLLIGGIVCILIIALVYDSQPHGNFDWRTSKQWKLQRGEIYMNHPDGIMRKIGVTVQIGRWNIDYYFPQERVAVVNPIK